jgi:cleavage stimulation factor subunit 2
MSKSCSIFVGNVPYDADEEELKEVFAKAGDVVSVRVVNDRDTLQPKGFAFVDFTEQATVAQAIDKLNNVEYKGRRLRVDYAERELSRRGGDSQGGSGRSGPGGGPAGPGRGAPPPEPVPVMPVTTVADRLARIREHEAAEAARSAALEHAELAELARFIETLTPQQLFHIYGEMQRLSMRAPEVARALVTENVQLCLVLQHAQFLLGLADEPPLPTDAEVREQARNVRRKVFGTNAVEGTSSALPAMPPLGALGPLGFPLPDSGLTAPPPPGFPAAPLAQLGALVAAASAALAGAAGLAAASSPVSVPSMPTSGAAPANPDKNKQELLEKLSKLSKAQIDQLPDATKMELLNFLQTLPPQQAA